MKKAFFFLAAILVLSLTFWTFATYNSKQNFQQAFGVSPTPFSDGVQNSISRVLKEKESGCALHHKEFEKAATNAAIEVKELKKFQDNAEESCENWRDAMSLAEKFGYKN